MALSVLFAFYYSLVGSANYFGDELRAHLRTPPSTVFLSQGSDIVLFSKLMKIVTMFLVIMKMCCSKTKAKRQVIVLLVALRLSIVEFMFCELSATIGLLLMGPSLVSSKIHTPHCCLKHSLQF